MEKRKAWTAHGEMHPFDRKVIEELARDNIIAARIFVTGEVHETYIGDQAVRLLINLNNVLYDSNPKIEPLFVQTKRHTVKMTRFDPEFVWRCFNPDVLTANVKAEAERLGVNLDPWAMDHFDFYQSMIVSLRAEKGMFSVPQVHYDSRKLDDYYNAVYLTCLLLFDKPGYMDIPVQEHFADVINAQHLGLAKFVELNDVQKSAILTLRQKYGSIQALTNYELDYVTKIYLEE